MLTKEEILSGLKFKTFKESGYYYKLTHSKDSEFKYIHRFDERGPVCSYMIFGNDIGEKSLTIIVNGVKQVFYEVIDYRNLIKVQ